MSQLRNAFDLIAQLSFGKPRSLAMLAGAVCLCVPAGASFAQSSKSTPSGAKEAATQPVERPSSNGASRRSAPMPESAKQDTITGSAPANAQTADKEQTPRSEPAAGGQDQPFDNTTQEKVAPETQKPLVTFPMRGVALRSVSLGVGFEYAWFGKVQSVTLRSFSGGSDGMRVLTLPAGAKVADIQDGSKVKWQAIGAIDGNPSLVSDEDFKQFQALLPGANDAKAMHRFVAADDSAKWELQYTLENPLQDNRAGEDRMPELAIAFASPKSGADAQAGITVVALDAKGRETGTPMAVTIGDARATTPELTLSHLNARGVTEGTAQVMLATVDLSRLGVFSTTSLLVRPIRAGDTMLNGETVSGKTKPVPFKLIAVETAGMPLPAWASGD